MAINKEEVAEAVREWCAAWHSNNGAAIAAIEAPAVGFGYRVSTERSH